MRNALADHLDMASASVIDGPIIPEYIGHEAAAFVRIRGLEFCGYQMSQERARAVRNFVIKKMEDDSTVTAAELAAAVIAEFDLQGD